ncbi:MAG: hypothetical protein HRT72_05840 [Flavobacteriales bacterium]|nr:hypothetical protein [Flavobacteriales bacterium]
MGYEKLNSETLTKLLTYSGVAISVISSSVKVEAETILVDISPDTTLFCASSESLIIDFNSDNIPDLTITAAISTISNAPYVGVSFVQGYAVGYTWSSVTSYGWAFALPQSFVVDANANFLATRYASLVYWNGSKANPNTSYNLEIDYPWVQGLYGPNTSGASYTGLHNVYMGLKFYIDGNEHYGWVNMQVNSQEYPGVRVISYAYEDQSNTAIITSISKIEEIVFDIYSFENTIFISNVRESDLMLRIMTIDGKMVFEDQISQGDNVINTGLKEGIFLTTISNGTELTSVKLYLNR